MPLLLLLFSVAGDPIQKSLSQLFLPFSNSFFCFYYNRYDVLPCFYFCGVFAMPWLRFWLLQLHPIKKWVLNVMFCFSLLFHVVPRCFLCQNNCTQDTWWILSNWFLSKHNCLESKFFLFFKLMQIEKNWILTYAIDEEFKIQQMGNEKWIFECHSMKFLWKHRSCCCCWMRERWWEFSENGMKCC